MHILPLGVLQRLDDIIYDARLRASMPMTLDPRIVIVDLDEKSLAEVGRWPWGRNKLADMMQVLFDEQNVAVVGFDIVFAEEDDSSGLSKLRELAAKELRGQPGFVEKLNLLESSLDYDALFAKSLVNRPVVMGYYLTSDRDGNKSGTLPKPTLTLEDMQGRRVRATSWNGFGSNIDLLARSAPLAGHFNSIADDDGVGRSLPLLAEFQGKYYESLTLAVFRRLAGMPAVGAGFPDEDYGSANLRTLESVLLTQGDRTMAIPVDDRIAALVPFRGLGGATGGSFQYISASDVLARRVPPNSLQGKVVLVGATAPGLMDLRVTPVGQAYPGVETHANLISGLMDGRVLAKPDFSLGYDVALLVLVGLGLALLLPRVSAPRAVLLSLLMLGVLVGINFWFFSAGGLVLPLAASVSMTFTAFAVNMSYGYFVESRSKRELANLFGTYVPPELVDEMVKDPDSYSMKATNRELTVMFCDMRGFTKMSEHMEPIQLQELLNGVFSRLTGIIRGNRGTIDKYMGDCVMAFWGAPVETSQHASLATKSAMEMAAVIKDINDEHRARGLPEIGIGVGLNTGFMCVGDMGSDIRRSYTVIGDAVNLGSRLEGLSKAYGVDIVISETTQAVAAGYAWQELDRVRVKGKELAVAIFYPVATADRLGAEAAAELQTWTTFLQSYRDQDWDAAETWLSQLLHLKPNKYLYQLYAERVASMRLLPFDPEWDGATNFETK
ncbi:MAG: adenylate/guanylate cyclase domain-containing protein [Rhodoferax sp.]|nr:adenylate/guanylate cyclase domain-containing protein [Rhodoferax sp.]